MGCGDRRTFFALNRALRVAGRARSHYYTDRSGLVRGRVKAQPAPAVVVNMGQGPGRDFRAACRFAVEDLTISSLPFACLAIETATDFPSIALLRGSALTVRECHGLRTPSRQVFEWVGEVLEESSTSLAELDCIAFGAGPGSFTGVRVAVGLAQSLGYARDLPVCPVSTLAALAAGALRNGSAEAVACCLDAHMGEVYLGMYGRDPDLVVKAWSPDFLGAPADVILPGPRRYLGVGPGWAAYPELADRWQDRLTGLEPDRRPSAVDVAHLARPLFHSGAIVRPADAHPNYLRHRVASVARPVTAGGSD